MAFPDFFRRTGELEGQPAAGGGAAENDIEQGFVAGAVGGEEGCGSVCEVRDDGWSFEVDGDHGGNRLEERQDVVQFGFGEVEASGSSSRSVPPDAATIGALGSVGMPTRVQISSTEEVSSANDSVSHPSAEA